MVSKLSFVVVLAVVSYSCAFPAENRGFIVVRVGADKLALASQHVFEAQPALHPKPPVQTALFVINPQSLLDAQAALNPNRILEAALHLDRAKTIRTDEEFDEDEAREDHLAAAELEYRRWGGHPYHESYNQHQDPWY